MNDLLSLCINAVVISVINKQTNKSMSLGSLSSSIVISDRVDSPVIGDDNQSNGSILSGSITKMWDSNYSSSIINKIQTIPKS